MGTDVGYGSAADQATDHRLSTLAAHQRLANVGDGVAAALHEALLLRLYRRYLRHGHLGTRLRPQVDRYRFPLHLRGGAAALRRFVAFHLLRARFSCGKEKELNDLYPYTECGGILGESVTVIGRTQT